MLGLVEELNDTLKELKGRVEPLKDALIKVSSPSSIICSPYPLGCLPPLQASALSPVDDELGMYLEVKQQLLLSYVINSVFYLVQKVTHQERP
jgi:hypothetical protein